MRIRGLSHEGLTLLYIADGICKCLPSIVVTLPSRDSPVIFSAEKDSCRLNCLQSRSAAHLPSCRSAAHLPSFLSSFPFLPPENKEENDYQRNTASLLLIFLPITAKSFPRIVYFFISSL